MSYLEDVWYGEALERRLIYLPIEADLNAWEVYCDKGLDELDGSQAEESDLATMCAQCTEEMDEDAIYPPEEDEVGW